MVPILIDVGHFNFTRRQQLIQHDLIIEIKTFLLFSMLYKTNLMALGRLYVTLALGRGFVKVFVI